MRAGFIIYGDPEQCTGGYIYNRYLISHLLSKGHEVELICLPDKPYLRKIFTNISPSLIKKISSLEPDILIQDVLCLPSLIGLNKILSYYFTFPKTALVHQLIFLRRQRNIRRNLYFFLEKSYFKTTDAIIVNSETLLNSIKKDLGVKRPGLVARPGGDRLGVVSGKAIEEKCYRKGPLKLFFLGNILPNKGLHTLIMALKGLDWRIWSLSVAGSLEMDRKYAEYVMKIIMAYKLSAKVRLLGLLDRESLKQEMKDHHVLTMPFSVEGFGIAYLEGMSQGLPAVGCAQGAAGEIITHGRNGFLVGHSRDDDLREYLTRLYFNRDKLKSMSMAALGGFAGFSAWGRSMEEVRLFLEHLTAGSGR